MKQLSAVLCLSILLTGCGSFLQTSSKGPAFFAKRSPDKALPANKSQPIKLDNWGDQLDQLVENDNVRDLKDVDVNGIGLEHSENTAVFESMDIDDFDKPQLPVFLEKTLEPNIPTAQAAEVNKQIQSEQIEQLPGHASSEGTNDHVSDLIEPRPLSIRAIPAADVEPDYSQSKSMYLLEQRKEERQTSDSPSNPIRRDSNQSTRRNPSSRQLLDEKKDLQPQTSDTSSVYFKPVPDSKADSSWVETMSADWDASLETKIARNQFLPTDFPFEVQEADKNNKTDETSWRKLLDQTIDALEQQQVASISSRSNHRFKISERIRAALQARLLRLSAGDIEGALQPVEGLSSQEQAFWHHQFVALNGFLHHPSARIGEAALNPNSAQEVLNSMQNAQRELAQLAPLQISKTELCQSVDGFGQYQKIENNFAPGDQAIIYCELRNFSANIIDSKRGQRYSSRLQGGYQIINDQNEVVSQRQFETTEDLSRNMRTDFYMYFPLTIPELPEGSYRLNISIEDTNANKIVEKTHTSVLHINSTTNPKTATQPSHFRR